MKAMTETTAAQGDCRSRVKDGEFEVARSLCKRTTRNRTLRLGAHAGLSLLLLLPLLVAAGCQDRSSEQAQQEVAEARATIEQLKHNLNKAREEISTLRAELGAVRQNRDELQESIVQLTEDRDQASRLAQQAQVMVAHLTSRANSQVNATAALEKQIAELKALVEEQHKLIEHLQKGSATEPTPVETVEEPSLPTEPNENP